MDLTKPILANLPNLPRTPEECVSWAGAFHQAYYQQMVQLLSLLGGNVRWQNLRSNLQTAAIVGAAPAVFSLTHNLNKVPETALWLLDQAGSIYATGANKAAWTNKTIQLTSSVSPANAVILVL